MASNNMVFQSKKRSHEEFDETSAADSNAQSPTLPSPPAKKARVAQKEELSITTQGISPSHEKSVGSASSATAAPFEVVAVVENEALSTAAKGIPSLAAESYELCFVIPSSPIKETCVVEELALPIDVDEASSLGGNSDKPGSSPLEVSNATAGTGEKEATPTTAEKYTSLETGSNEAPPSAPLLPTETAGAAQKVASPTATQTESSLPAPTTVSSPKKPRITPSTTMKHPQDTLGTLSPLDCTSTDNWKLTTQCDLAALEVLKPQFRQAEQDLLTRLLAKRIADARTALSLRPKTTHVAEFDDGSDAESDSDGFNYVPQSASLVRKGKVSKAAPKPKRKESIAKQPTSAKPGSKPRASGQKKAKKPAESLKPQQNGVQKRRRARKNPRGPYVHPINPYLQRREDRDLDERRRTNWAAATSLGEYREVDAGSTVHFRALVHAAAVTRAPLRNMALDDPRRRGAGVMTGAGQMVGEQGPKAVPPKEGFESVFQRAKWEAQWGLLHA